MEELIEDVLEVFEVSEAGNDTQVTFLVVDFGKKGERS